MSAGVPTLCRGLLMTSSNVRPPALKTVTPMCLARKNLSVTVATPMQMLRSPIHTAMDLAHASTRCHLRPDREFYRRQLAISSRRTFASSNSNHWHSTLYNYTCSTARICSTPRPRWASVIPALAPLVPLPCLLRDQRLVVHPAYWHSLTKLCKRAKMHWRQRPHAAHAGSPEGLTAEYVP